MRLIIAAVGRLKKGPEAELAQDYLARSRALGAPFGVTDFSLVEVEAPKGPARASRESERLAAAIPAASFRIALDERGDMVSSEAFAKLIADARDRGSPATAFLIGGADGFGVDPKSLADRAVAFGRATWPHLLVRAMLCEQIYRAMTIFARHPYHRS